MKRIPTDPQCQEDVECIAIAVRIIGEMKASGEFSWNEFLWQDLIAQALIDKDKEIRKLRKEVASLYEQKQELIRELPSDD